MKKMSRMTHAKAVFSSLATAGPGVVYDLIPNHTPQNPPGSLTDTIYWPGASTKIGYS